MPEVFDRYEYNPEDDEPEYGNVIINQVSEMKRLAQFDMNYYELFRKLEEKMCFGVESLLDDFNFNKTKITSIKMINDNGIQIKIDEQIFEIHRGYCSEHQHYGWYVYDEEIDDYVAINSLDVYR